MDKSNVTDIKRRQSEVYAIILLDFVTNGQN